MRLALDELVAHDALDIRPILGVAVFGEGDGQAHVVHQSAGLGGDDLAFARHHLGDEAEAGGEIVTEVAVDGIDAREEALVAGVQRVIGQAHQGAQRAVHVPAVAYAVLDGEQTALENLCAEASGERQRGLIIHQARADHQAFDAERIVGQAALRGALRRPCSDAVHHAADGLGDGSVESRYAVASV